MQKVFISYSREDKVFALRLAEDLRAADVEIWIDQLDIPPGVVWDDSVEKALDLCQFLMVILSPKSIESENVKDEIAYALDAKKQIIPVLYKECKIPLRIRRLNYIDFTSDYNSGKTKLIEVLMKDEPSQTTPEFIKPPPEFIKPLRVPSYAEMVRKELLQRTINLFIKTEVKEPEKISEPSKTKKEYPEKEVKSQAKKTMNWYRVVGIITIVVCLLIVGYVAYLIIHKTTFRTDPLELSQNDVKDMLEKYNFSCQENSWSENYCNPDGKGFKNKFVLKFVLKNDSIVYDYASDLMWQRSGSSREMKFEASKKYIDELNERRLAGFNNWRLPTLEEAMSLMESEKKNEDLYIDHIFDSEQDYIWTSDQVKGESWAWVVSFGYGSCGGYGNYVRAVRSVQPSEK